ncbi:hypothetical protein HHK36_003071 [Tetracentron sinense]|uniref:Uncharacterized protein n=1 Tax=Tetracentron sinense TaxID=13715 RepID=A0A834ZNF2_TETSI|nr:hypothetical protein HHK36_003071 [Tetracentron sinense]
MGLGALRNIARPLAKAITKCSSVHFPMATLPTSPFPAVKFRSGFGSLQQQYPWISRSNDFHSLTDTRLPKRRPGDKPRRKRASLKPPGPYAWVQYVPGEPILANRPNEGSVKGRKEKKRMRQRRAFILVCDS